MLPAICGHCGGKRIVGALRMGAIEANSGDMVSILCLSKDQLPELIVERR
jgi:hypothetical protein